MEPPRPDKPKALLQLGIMAKANVDGALTFCSFRGLLGRGKDFLFAVVSQGTAEKEKIA